MSKSSKEPQRTPKISVPRVMVVGTGRGVGTSTVVLGLLIALKKQRSQVAASKVGPSLSATTNHRRITGRLSHNFDPWMLSQEQLITSLSQVVRGAEILVVEGEQGVYDRRGEEFSVSRDVDLARILKTPIILVLDARCYQESAAAVVHGFANFESKGLIAGVIANRVLDPMHNQRIKKAIESLKGPIYLGGVPEDEAGFTESDTRTVLSARESLLTRSRLLRLGNLIQSSLNLDYVCKIAERAGAIELMGEQPEDRLKRCRIAIADDQAFHLTIQDNLSLLRCAGAELTAFSPLTERELPSEIKGIYLPGGYPDQYAKELQENTVMRQAIRTFVQHGGALYAEGSAQSYLCDRMVLASGTAYDMVGLIPATAVSSLEQHLMDNPVYVEIEAGKDTVLSRYSTVLRGFRQSQWILRLEEELASAFKLREGSGVETSSSKDPLVSSEGIVAVPNTLTTGLHVHWGSAKLVAESFLGAATKSNPLQY